MLLGVWAAAEGQVYDAWRDAVHVADPETVAEFLDHSPWFFGAADWGWVNPGVLHVYAVDHDDRLLLVAEHYHTHRPVEGWWVPHAVELSERFGFLDWICDPSEPQNIELFRRAGLNARGAINDLLPGITAVQDRLGVDGSGRPRLMLAREALLERDEALVAAKLPWSTLQEVPEYVWARNAGGVLLKEKPVDQNNHGMDTMRYAVAHLDLSGGVVRPLDPQLAAAFAYLPG
jgi:phage terminase large subunit